MLEKSTTNVSLTIICLFFLFQTIYSQQNKSSEIDWRPKIEKLEGKSSFAVALSFEERKKMEAIWEEIGQEIKNEENNVAGTFVNLGYQNGYFLRISPNKSFILIPYYDQNLISDFSYGKVGLAENSEIIFSPERDLIQGRPFEKIPRKWTTIGISLTPIEQLRDLGLYRAGLGIYNDYNGDCCGFSPKFTNHKVEGNNVSQPIPQRFRHFFIKPISGKIIFASRKKIVKEWIYEGHLYSAALGKTALIPVKINIGRKQGVKKNMLFRLAGNFEYNQQQYLQIIKITNNSSEGFVVRALSFEGKDVYHDDQSDTDKTFPSIMVGTKISTSFSFDN